MVRKITLWLKLPIEEAFDFKNDNIALQSIVLSLSLSLSPSLSLSLSLIHSIPSADIPLLLPVSAVNCADPDLASRLNHLYMQRMMGKHFI